ncbi:MAG: hypothetical protein ACJ76V_14300 [Thermoleophilaceae bacterium]
MTAEPGQDGLSRLVDELEQAASQLRSGELEGEEAAALVERCADVAGQLAGELERRERAVVSGEPAPGQERLL